MSNTSSGELLLREILKFNIDNNNVLYNYRGLGIINPKTGYELEIDIYYPDYKLAFEFQGEEHFKTTSFTNKETLKEILFRDSVKENFCKENGILLIKIKALDLNAYIGRFKDEVVPGLKLFPRSRQNEQDLNKIKLLEWKCSKYRKHLNNTYPGHESSRTDVKIWRDKVKALGIEIPESLRRCTFIHNRVREAVENGTYTEELHEKYRTIKSQQEVYQYNSIVDK
jgi:hypothetical protein